VSTVRAPEAFEELDTPWKIGRKAEQNAVDFPVAKYLGKGLPSPAVGVDVGAVRETVEVIHVVRGNGCLGPTDQLESSPAH
jgi:hypothetical protein